MPDQFLEFDLLANQTPSLDEHTLDDREKTKEQLIHELTCLKQQVIELQSQGNAGFPVLNRITDGFFVVDRQWQIVYLNSYTETIIRRSRQDIIGKNFWNEYPALEGTIIDQKYHEALETGIAVHFEAFDQAFERWWEIHAYPDATGLSVFFRDIDHRKQIEAQQQSLLTELTEWQSRYEVVGQVSNQILYEWDAVTDRATWSANTEQILGYTQAEMPENIANWLALIHPIDQPTVQHLAEQAIQNRACFQAEYRFLHKAGHYIWVSEKCQFVPDSTSRINRAIGFITDIDQRKQAEQALRENQEIFQQIVENIQEAFFICTLECHRVLYISPAYEQIWGRSCDSLYRNPQSWLDAVHPEDRNRVVAALERQPQGEAFCQEYRIVRPDGSIRWIFDRTALIQDENGQIYRVTGIAEDVTERRHAEAALREIVEFNQQIVANMQEGVIVYGRDFQYLLWNQAMEQMSGLRAETVLGKRPIDVFPFLEETGIYKILTRALAGETIIAPDAYFHIPETGKSGWTCAKFSPFKDARGCTLGVMAIVHDVTHRKQTELDLEYRIRFERLLTQLSIQFINLKLDEIDDSIRQGLEAIGRFAQVDWVWIYLYSEDGSIVTKAYEWVASGVTSPLESIETIPGDAFAWSLAQMRQSQPIYVANLNDLPPEAAVERNSAEAIGTRSFVAVPMTHQGNLIGSLGFHTFRSPKHCSAEDLNLFTTLGTLFASTILRKRSETSIRAIVRVIPDLLIRFNRAGIYLELVNAGNIKLLKSVEACLGKSMDDILPPDMAEERMYYLQQAFETGELQVYDYQIEVEGEILYEEARIVVSGDDEALFIIRDITDRKRAELALRLQAERERVITEITQNIHRSLDLNQILNTTATKIRQLLQTDRVLFYRIEPEQTVSALDSCEPGDYELSSRVVADSAAEDYLVIQGEKRFESCPSIERCFQNQTHSNIDVQCLNPSNCNVESLLQLQVKANLVIPILQDDRIWGLLIVQHCSALRTWQQTEIDLLKQLASQVAVAIQQSELCQQLQIANRELHRLADQDGLTQVANRRRFDEYLNLQWQQLKRNQFPLTLILCDVDNFKLYNDRYGHQAGDRCLQQIAQAIQCSIKRSTDLVARYGGEEFAIILLNTEVEGALHMAETIQAKIAQLCIPHDSSSVSQYVTLSIGIASIVPRQTTSLQELIAAADQALYDAKSKGRNRYCVRRL